MIMVSKKQGFSLVEVLIYLPCSLLLCSCMAYLSQQFQGALLKAAATAETSIELALALDSVINDLAQLTVSGSQWKEAKATHLIFNNGHHDIGWLVDNARLLRITGSYCKETGCWKKRATTVFLQQVTAFECFVYGPPLNPKAIRCTIRKERVKKLRVVTSLIALQV